MSSHPPSASNVGSGEDDDTIVNGDWSLALQSHAQPQNTQLQYHTKVINQVSLSRSIS